MGSPTSVTCSLQNGRLGAVAAVSVAPAYPTFCQGIGQINISDLEGPPIWAEALFFFLVASGWFLFYRQLNLWNRNKGFGYWFPTLMLVAVTMMFLFIDRINAPPWMNVVFVCIGYIIGGINFPILAVAAILSGVWIEALPLWIRIVSAAAVFWLSWHLFLRYMRRRALERYPVSLNLASGIHDQHVSGDTRVGSPLQQLRGQ